MDSLGLSLYNTLTRIVEMKYPRGFLEHILQRWTCKMVMHGTRHANKKTEFDIENNGKRTRCGLGVQNDDWDYYYRPDPA